MGRATKMPVTKLKLIAKQTELVYVPGKPDDWPDPPKGTEIREYIWGAFGDNGGAPDGNAYLAPADWFTSEEISWMRKAAGARVVMGWEIDYGEEAREIVDDWLLSQEHLWTDYSGIGKICAAQM